MDVILCHTQDIPSTFLFIIKGFRNIVFIFIVISTTADISFGLLKVFVELVNLHGTSNYVLD